MLNRCIATDLQTFATEHWGRVPLLSRSDALPRDFSDLLSARTVDELLAERGVRAPFIRLAKEGEVLARECYLGPAGFGAEMPDQVDSAKVLNQFASGATIVLQGLHRLWPPLIDFVRSMVDDLGHPVQANGYITPPKSFGFDPHYDVHDVFVLQTAGRKHWTVHEPVHDDPLASQPWTDHREAIAQRVIDGPIIDTVLSPGDALYLPRGWVHSAQALGALSIHLTIGVSPLTGMDVVRAVVDQLENVVDFRKSLPMGMDQTDQDEMMATATKIVAELTETIRDRTSELGEVAAMRLAQRYAARTRPVSVRPLASLEAAEHAATAKVRWRQGLVATIERCGGRVLLRLPDRIISLPKPCGDAVVALYRGLIADAGSLPGLDAADGEVVIRRLLREGVVIPAEHEVQRAPRRMTAAGRAPCSDQSLTRNDPMYGTASAGFSWMMLELAGPWGDSAFLESPTIIEPVLGRAIVRRAEAAGMRIAAIRRHGRRSATPRWRWFVAHAHPGREALYHGEVTVAREYLDVALDGSDGQRAPRPLVAVCTHGKHDQCCAVRGRGAVAAIAAEFPELTWECSHLGGDRFAATMLILPEGLCYGRVDSTDPPNLVRLYLAGRLDNGFLRGRTSLPHAVQAAQYFAREASRDDRINTLLPLRVEPSENATRVVLQADSGRIEVIVSEQLSDPLLSRCGATVAGRVRTFALVSVNPG